MVRKFLSPSRLWGTEGGPDENWIRPHVLWLPSDQPQVLAYFRLLREVLAGYTDVVTPVAEEDLHWTIQPVRGTDRDGYRVTGQMLAVAARTVQDELRNLEPFEIEIGPAGLSGSAATVAIWPEDGPSALNRHVRSGLLAAGLELPPAELWPHMSAGYGVQDCDRPELAARSDRLASDLTHGIRPGIRTRAAVTSVWLVWERQNPAHNTYTFEPLHEIRLGRRQPPAPPRPEALSLPTHMTDRPEAT